MNLTIDCQAEQLIAELPYATLPFRPTCVWNPSPSTDHRMTPYELPMSIGIGIQSTEETGAKFSPCPFVVILEDGESKALVQVKAEPGWHLWNMIRFDAQQDVLRVLIDLEGHSEPTTVRDHVTVEVTLAEAGQSRQSILREGLLDAYPEAAARVEVPDWWLRPIYCGWGDQVAFAHWLEGVGPEPRALAYCTQGLYERWIRRLDEADVPFGTVIIDHGWSPAGSWEPNPVVFPDLKGFIAAEHERGRKVLLWIATWLWDGLPDEWCVFCDGKKLCADPTHPDYLAYVQAQVTRLLSPDGYDADGFKIDQLAFSPDERHPRGGARFGHTAYLDPPQEKLSLHGEGWGVELLHRLQKTIYDAAKAAKPDALITSSTVHPYFHDTYDMTRLHDMGSVAADLFAAMQGRADLSLAALPGKPIDADDWITRDYAKWLDYTSHSRRIGVPCIFYSERFIVDWQEEPATVPIPLADLQQIGEAWRSQGGC